MPTEKAKSIGHGLAKSGEDVCVREAVDNDRSPIS